MNLTKMEKNIQKEYDHYLEQSLGLDIYDDAPKFKFSTNELRDIFLNKKDANPTTVKNYMECLLNRVELIHAPKVSVDGYYCLYIPRCSNYQPMYNMEIDTKLMSIFEKVDRELEIGIEYPVYEYDNTTVISNYRVNPLYSESTDKQILKMDKVIPLRALLIAFGKLKKSEVDPNVNIQASIIRKILTIDDIDTILTYGRVGISTAMCNKSVGNNRQIDWYTHWLIKIVEENLQGGTFLKFESIVNDLVSCNNTVMNYINNHYM